MWMKLPDGGLLNLDQAYTLEVSRTETRGEGYQVRAIAPHGNNPVIVLGEFDSKPEAIAYVDNLALVSCSPGGFFRGELGFGPDSSSVAAHERARTLDPKITTSVEHTYMQLGEFERALAAAPEHGDSYLRAAHKAWQGDDAAAIQLLERALEEGFEGAQDYYIGAPLDALKGRVAEAEAKLRRVRDMGVRDPEAIFLLARTAGRAGAVELGLELIETMIERGFYAIEGLERDPWFDSLRGEPRFQAALKQAREGQREAAAAFREAGGAEILGVVESFPDDSRTATPHQGV